MSYGGYGFPNNYGMTYQQSNGFQNNFNNSETKENKNYVTVDKFNELNSEVARLKDVIIQQNNTIQELSKVKPTKTQNKEAK